MSEARPEPPETLRESGAALWTAIFADMDPDWMIDARERHLLERACRCEDEMRELEKAVDSEGATAVGSKNQIVAHPGILEARQLKLAQLRLLSALELEDPSTAVSRATPATARARKAARSRWGNRNG